MAGRVKIKVRGIREIRRRLRALDETLKRSLKEEVRKQTVEVKRRAQAEAPRKTGALRRSIRRRTLRGGFFGVVFSDSPYGSFVEFGTPRRRPAYPRQPFLRPALEADRRNFERKLRAIVRRKIGVD